MRPANDELHRLIGAARRRWIAVRAAEHATAGAVIGAIAASAAAGILWWQGAPSLSIVLWLMGLGAGVGATLSLFRRPGRVATAQRLDEQHRLHELFSTAIALRDRDDPTVAATVRALAAAAAVRVAAGEPLRIARWGGTAYSSAAMIASLTIALSAIASQDRPRFPGASNDRGGLSPEYTERTTFPGHAAMALPKSPVPRQIDEASGGRGEDVALARVTPDADPRGASDPASGQRGATSGDRLSAPPDAPQASGSPRSATGDENAPHGAGEAVRATANNGDVARGTVERSPLPPQAGAAGRTSITPAQRSAAESSMRRGDVPEAYRDLVRAYFSRD